jgi:hypothetical protein
LIAEIGQPGSRAVADDLPSTDVIVIVHEA